MTTEIIFEKQGDDWVGQVNNLTYRFKDYQPDEVYASMLEVRSDWRIGFKSMDIGASTFLKYGPVMWMTVASEF